MGLRSAALDFVAAPTCPPGPAPGPALAPVPVRGGQGWTGPLGPLSRRSDCMIWNVVV